MPISTGHSDDGSSGEKTTVTLAEAMVSADTKMERIMETNTQIMAQLASKSIANNH